MLVDEHRQSRCFAILLLAVCSVIVAACGSEPAESVLTDVALGADLGGEPDAVEGCIRDSDCGGGYCVGPAGCNAIWMCQEENPCSAVAPFVACTCRGVYDYVAAGCPNEKWAYWDDGLPEYLVGTPCPEDGPVQRAAIVVTGDGFLDSEDELARLTLRDNTHGANVDYGATAVYEGAFEARFWDVFNPAEADYTVTLWFDDNETGECDGDDRAWTYPVPTVLEERGAVVVVRPDDPFGACGPN